MCGYFQQNSYINSYIYIYRIFSCYICACFVKDPEDLDNQSIDNLKRNYHSSQIRAEGYSISQNKFTHTKKNNLRFNIYIKEKNSVLYNSYLDFVKSKNSSQCLPKIIIFNHVYNKYIEFVVFICFLNKTHFHT